MPGLELKKNNDTFVLDPSGSAMLNNAAIGTWNTDEANKIVITKNDQTTVKFDVVWEFDPNNQLVVSAGGKQFNFHEVAATVPRYETRDALLVVKPNKNKPFSFSLSGDWALSESHDLSLTINGKTSVIDGFIHDNRSRFMFHFSNKKNLLQGSVLGFVGTWSEFVDEHGKPRLKFIYTRAGKPDADFTLPKGIVVDRATNQLMYEYDKKNKKQRIQLVGTLVINNDFTITYGLDRQTSTDGQQQVANTTFTFAASFKNKNFTGDLELAISGASGTTTLTIAGKFTAVLGPNTRLKAGFTFEQKRAGNQPVTTTFGFAGELEFKNGKIQWTFTTTNTATKSIVLSILVDIKISDTAQLDARLNLLMEGGKVRGITFFLGIAF